MYNHKTHLTALSQSLRKNMTKQERHLWYDFLKNLPITVKRQYPIENYILDFYVANAKIAIELDGSQHYDTTIEKDRQRDAKLQSLGITVLRYANSDINENFEGVCLDIAAKLGIDMEL